MNTLTPARTCRWFSAGSADLLATGGCAGLAITTPRGTSCYWVERIPTGYRLLKEGADETYTIDTTFGPKAEHWTCDCGAYVWEVRKARRRRHPVPCKHIAALAAALKSIGLRETTR